MAEGQFSINAGWEIKPGRSICRWFCAWKAIKNNEIAGAIAGYSGGGCFECEEFYAKIVDGDLVSLWIDFTDHITDEEIEFNSLDPNILEICAEAYNRIWEWNDEHKWNDSDEIILLKSKQAELKKEDDMLYLDKGMLPQLRFICNKAGLTAGPFSQSS